MKKRVLQLDYQASPRCYKPLGLILLALGAVMAIMATLEYRAAHEQATAAEEKIDRLLGKQVRRHAPRAGAEVGPAETKAAIAAANTVAATLSLPWVRLFHALEAARDSNVALLAIEPNAKTQTVRLIGQADRLERILTYLKRLQKQPALTDVALAEHEIMVNDPESPVRFTVTATWTGEQ